jgi:hypothetical protein
MIRSFTKHDVILQLPLKKTAAANSGLALWRLEKLNLIVPITGQL